MALAARLEEAFAARDPGEIMLWVDGGYQDGLGGRGRLEDDLRRLFEVYGRLRLKHHDLHMKDRLLEAQLELENERLSYRGPHFLGVRESGTGWVLQSGLLEIPRGILDSLRERRLALEQGDLLRLSRVISENYQGEGGGKKELLRRLEEDLTCGQRALMVDRLTIIAESQRAEAIASFLLIVLSGDKKEEYRGREKVHLQLEAGRWRITGGLG